MDNKTKKIITEFSPIILFVALNVVAIIVISTAASFIAQQPFSKIERIYMVLCWVLSMTLFIVVLSLNLEQIKKTTEKLLKNL